MGKIYTNILLTNEIDRYKAKHHEIGEEEVRKIDVNALVDTGADWLIINELIKNQLGLEVTGTRLGELADGSVQRFDIVGPVRLQMLGTREVSTEAMVIPGDSEVLIGAIPMQSLDVLIDLKNEEISLPPDRPYLAKLSLK